MVMCGIVINVPRKKKEFLRKKLNIVSDHYKNDFILNIKDTTNDIFTLSLDASDQCPFTNHYVADKIILLTDVKFVK
ncbi:hypothetical protein KSF78_0006215 [Schistosoma japonicum]|nr:hypothetical protein KSF78_0006215 [Schistosoma japonicum]